MGFVDAFMPDGTVELKISDLQSLFRSDALNYADNKCMVNGLKAGLPHRHILIMIGEDEKENKEVLDGNNL